MAIAVSSSILAVSTYFLLGLHPLLALWIGLTVVGLSMLLTPLEPRASGVSELVLDSFENLEKLLEVLGLRSEALYIPSDRGVYAVISDKIPNPSDLNLEILRHSLFLELGERIGAVVKIPLPRAESGDICAALEEVAVDTLGIASWIECTFDGKRLGARFHSARAMGFARIAKTLGSVHSVLAAALLARLMRRPTRVVEERREGDDVVTLVEVVETEGR